MKKRVKTSFKKVQKQEAINEVMINGSKDYSYNHGGVYITLTPDSSIKNFFAAYRAVKEDIQWWEDVGEMVMNSDGSYAMNGDDFMHIDVGMTRDGWCDFARALLEQESE